MRAASWVAVGLVLAIAHPAAAHQRATLVVESPSEGAVVDAGVVDVVVAAQGSAALAEVEFEMRLDGEPVDTEGGVGTGSLFTTFALRAGSALRLRVGLPRGGTHELRVAPARDTDDPRPDVVRRFTSTGATSVDPSPTPTNRGEIRVTGRAWLIPWWPLGAAAAAAAAAVAAVVWLRRRGEGGRDVA